MSESEGFILPLPKIGGIVLCGGHSRRMGCAKAWLDCHDEPLLHRVVRLVGQAAHPVVVANRPGQDLPPLPAGTEVVLDAVPHAGPLAGIAAGLAALGGQCDAAFVVACDHPLLEPRFIRRLGDLLGGHSAVVVEHGGRWHPLTALYRLKTHAIANELLERGTLAATAFAERCRPRIVRAADFADCDPKLASLCSFNAPEGYAALLERVRGD